MKRTNGQTGSWLKLLVVATLFIAACGGKRSDEQVQQDVTNRLAGGEGQTAYGSVSATVKDGVVTLSGRCEGDHCGDSAVARVNEVEGVKEVVNNIEQVPAQTDHTLRTSVQTIISKYSGVQADVAAGVVVLRGSIQRDQLQPLMNELSTVQAKKIDNQLAILQ